MLTHASEPGAPPPGGFPSLHGEGEAEGRAAGTEPLPSRRKEEPDRSRAIAAGIGWTLGGRGLAIVAALLSQILLARLLGPGGTGLIGGAALSVLALAMLAADLGINTSVSRLVAAALYRAPGEIPRIVRAGLFAKLVFTAAAGGALYLGARPLSAALGGGEALVPVLAATALQLVLDNIATFSFRGLQGLHRPGANAAAQTISGIGSPLGAVLFVVAGFGAAGAVLGRAAGAGLGAVAGLALLLRATRGLAQAAVPGAAGGEAHVSPWREIADYARRIVWVQLAYLAFFRVDRAIVFYFLGEHEAGLYSLPANIAEQCLLPAVAIATVAAPYFAAAPDRARRAFLGSLLARTVRVTTLIYAPAAAGLAVLAPDAVRVVFGRAFEGSVPIVRLYAPALFLLAHATLLGQILDYMGLAKSRAAAFVAAAAADLGANALFVPRLGPEGAVASLLGTFAPLVLFYIASLARRLGLARRALLFDLFRAVGAAAGMALALEAARRALSPAGPVRLFLLVAGGGAVYAVLLLALGGLRRSDWAEVRSLLHGSA